MPRCLQAVHSHVHVSPQMSLAILARPGPMWLRYTHPHRAGILAMLHLANFIRSTALLGIFINLFCGKVQLYVKIAGLVQRRPGSLPHEDRGRLVLQQSPVPCVTSAGDSGVSVQQAGVQPRHGNGPKDRSRPPAPAHAGCSPPSTHRGHRPQVALDSSGLRGPLGGWGQSWAHPTSPS